MNNIKNEYLGFYNSFALFDEELISLKQFVFDEELDIDNIDFSTLSIKKKIPLGQRIEYFFEFYINHSNRYNLVKRNIQVLKEKETLGELDFILYDNQLKIYKHVELVYKYYLFDESQGKDLNAYIGPNENDTLVKRIEKLRDRQLPMLYNNETKKYLEYINLDTLEQEVCFKANIYLPYFKEIDKIPIINNLCIKGYYISENDFFTNDEFKSYKYNLPKKSDWILDSNDCKEWSSYDEIKEEIIFFLDSKKSPLLWIKKDNKVEDFFVVWWK